MLMEANVVDSPAIDGDGGYALCRLTGGPAQAFIDADKDALERPMERRAVSDGAVGDAKDFGDRGMAIVPTKEGNAAAFGAEVNGDACAGITRKLAGAA